MSKGGSLVEPFSWNFNGISVSISLNALTTSAIDEFSMGSDLVFKMANHFWRYFSSLIQKVHDVSFIHWLLQTKNKPASPSLCIGTCLLRAAGCLWLSRASAMGGALAVPGHLWDSPEPQKKGSGKHKLAIATP